MTRLTSIAVVTVGLLASAAPAFAQQAEIAAKLNEDGKALMYDAKYAESSAKFRDAVARVPEPKYFFNLCTSLFAEGKFSDAMTACGGVSKNSPTAELDAKTTKLMERIEAEAKKQNVPLVMTGGGGGDPNDPGNTAPPDPTNHTPPGPTTGPGQTAPQYQQAYGRPPEQQNLFKSTSSDNRYTWTLGFDVFGGGGKFGGGDFYGNVAAGFRIKGDYLLNAAMRLGSQAWFSYTKFTQGDDQATSSQAYNLSIMDLGIGLYKDLCIKDRLCLRPLAGVELSFLSPGDEMGEDGSTEFNYTAAGARLELGAHFAFGSRLEHVLGIAVGANAYSPVFSESGYYAAEDIELDQGGAAGYVSLGYTYRFNTPLGSSPFVTLE